MRPACVAFKAHLGWVNAVAVRADTGDPVPIAAQRLDLLEEDDRGLSEPYHVAGGWLGLEQVPRPSDPAAVVARGRERQVVAAKERLQSYAADLASAGFELAKAVVLTTRGIPMDDLEHAIGSHAHIHVAEGEAIRDATRAALDSLGFGFAEQDEKSVLGAAGELLGRDAAACDEMMKPLKPEGTKSWRKEERLIALAAWLNR